MVVVGGPGRWGEQEVSGERTASPLGHRSWPEGSGCASDRPIGFLRLLTQKLKNPDVALRPQTHNHAAPW